MAEEIAALVDRIEPSRLLGAEVAGEDHPGSAALPAAAADADLTVDDQRPKAPLGQIVVGAAGRGEDELDDRAVESQETMGRPAYLLRRSIAVISSNARLGKWSSGP